MHDYDNILYPEDTQDVIDYDWLIMHSEEFLSDEECGIIPHHVLEEMMENFDELAD